MPRRHLSRPHVAPRHRCNLFISLILFVIACNSPQPTPSNQHAPTSHSAKPPPPTGSGVRPYARAAPSRNAAACSAASLRHSRPIDAYRREAMTRCVPLDRPPKDAAQRCGDNGGDVLDLDAVDSAAPPLRAATVRHLTQVAKRGRTRGRRQRSVGLIGDSMTVSAAFMRPFGSAAKKWSLSDAIKQRLTTRVGDRSDSTIIDYYRHDPSVGASGWRNSFIAPRVAKVGARTPWASPARVSQMLRQLSPAVGGILFGGNDAAYSEAPPDVLAQRYAEDMAALLAQLEAAGVMVILNTLARHGDSPGVANCGSHNHMGDWRVALNTNALSRRAAQLACDRQLPLIDLRHGLDMLPYHGLGPDAVHPTSHPRGSMWLNKRTLRCGYNLRNYLTLRMLKHIKEQILDPLDQP